jgi:hypothetical protein
MLTNLFRGASALVVALAAAWAFPVQVGANTGFLPSISNANSTVPASTPSILTHATPRVVVLIGSKPDRQVGAVLSGAFRLVVPEAGQGVVALGRTTNSHRELAPAPSRGPPTLSR